MPGRVEEVEGVGGEEARRRVVGVLMVLGMGLD
jgi:hypothetical protein